MFAPVPDGWTAVGNGFDGGQYGHYTALDMWMADGNVVSMLQWSPAVGGYDSGSTDIRAFMVSGYGNAPLGTTPHARMAVLAVPNPAPQQRTVVSVKRAQL